MISCQVCGKNYRHKKDLYRHCRNAHNIEPVVSGSIQCSMCSVKVYRQSDLVTHFELVHDIDCEKEELVFKSSEEFETWKKNFEEQTNASYVKHKGMQRLTNGTSKSVLLCNRQGTYVDRVGNRRVRSFRSKGSSKIGCACTSYMEVNKSGAQVRVMCWKRHSGHDTTAASYKFHAIKNNVMFQGSGHTENHETEENSRLLPPAKYGDVTSLDTGNVHQMIHDKASIVLSFAAATHLEDEEAKQVENHLDQILCVYGASQGAVTIIQQPSEPFSGDPESTVIVLAQGEEVVEYKYQSSSP